MKTLIDARRLDDFVRRITDGLPPDVAVLKGDLERNLRTVVQSALSRMDVVTREEFDVQRAVLARTREKLEQLETRVAELESAAVPKSSA